RRADSVRPRRTAARGARRELARGVRVHGARATRHARPGRRAPAGAVLRPLARRSHRVSVRVGTSGYNYPAWKGSFYPDDLPAAKMLPYYSARFPTVEINATFYRMPTAKTLAGWAAATPESFVLALKAPQRITHFARLKNVDDPLRFFCDTVRTL